MKVKDISPIQYSRWMGVHKSYVHRLLKGGDISKMPFVRKIKKYSRFYTLEVPADLTEDSFTTIVKKRGI